MININLQKLLLDAERILKHQEEISTLKGENFNVFSILKMESKENETHSAFLGELLDPKGSHGFGSLFLKRFLSTLKIDYAIDSSTAKLTLEKYIGLKDDDFLAGGRIDIFIEDYKGNTLCIENKIYASDQDTQLARYCNYNQPKNRVLYLTLNEEEPSEKSYLDFKLEEDFFLISYKKEILEWLELCQKDAIQHPILRETIHQYSILIKKLTNQLSNNQMENEIIELIASNYHTATIIKNNIDKVETIYIKKFIYEIEAELKNSLLPEDFTISVSEDLTKAWAGIYIKNVKWDNKLYVCLKGESKLATKSMYGIRCEKNKSESLNVKKIMTDAAIFKNGFTETNHWLCRKEIIDFSTIEARSSLFDENKRMELVNKTAKKLYDLVKWLEEQIEN